MEGLDSSGGPPRVGMQRADARKTGQVQVTWISDLEGTLLPCVTIGVKDDKELPPGDKKALVKQPAWPELGPFQSEGSAKPSGVRPTE